MNQHLQGCQRDVLRVESGFDRTVESRNRHFTGLVLDNLIDEPECHQFVDLSLARHRLILDVPRNLAKHADSALDALGDDEDASTLATSPAGAPYSVDVNLRILRHVVLNDEIDCQDIEAARSDIGGDEKTALAITEASHDTVTMLLRIATVQGFSADA